MVAIDYRHITPNPCAASEMRADRFTGGTLSANRAADFSKPQGLRR